MKTSWAYAPIAIFVGVAVFLAWPEPAATPEVLEISDEEQASIQGDDIAAAPVVVEQGALDREIITLSGTLVGYVAVSDSTGQSYTAALINDGIEVLRIDIRELVNYSATLPETALGIEINDVVVLDGYLKNGIFIATQIK